MSSDPRLENIPLLTLAAYRLQQRRGRQVPDWRYTEGISALLAAAHALPRRDPWALPTVEEGGGSMGLLLAEARRWEEARRGA